MVPVFRGVFLCACLAGPVACGDIGTLWGEDSRAEKERKADVQQAILNKVPIHSVRAVEMGRTRDGFLLTAFGTAPGLGYALPALQARRDGAPGVDGFLEFDFVATEPAPEFQMPQGTARTRALRADLALSERELRGARGIRVLTLTGGVELVFEPSA